MEDAISAGDIVWHALPFTTHSELYDADIFRFGLGLSELDRRFGRQTIASKMTDVPGHTRAIVPLLIVGARHRACPQYGRGQCPAATEAGVQFLHIGVNPASSPPDVSPLEVVSRGNRTLHAVQRGVRYAGSDGSLIIDSLDAPSAFARGT